MNRTQMFSQKGLNLIRMKNLQLQRKMKKTIKFIIFLLCMVLVFQSCVSSSSRKINIEIFYIPYNLMTVVPQTSVTVENCGKYVSKLISQKEFEEMKECLRKKKELSTIKVPERFNLDFLYKEKKQQNLQNMTTEIRTYERKIIDSDLNIRYVAKIHVEKSEIKIAFGQSENCIMIDNQFYEISSKSFSTLKNQFFEYTGDENH